MARKNGRSSDNPLDWYFTVGHRAGKKMIEVDDEKGCWIWQGHSHGGYGVMTYDSKQYPDIEVGRKRNDPKDGRRGSTWRAIMPHQFFYVRKYGNPPPDTQLAHTCHRRRCCNPDHVRPLSNLENQREKFLHPADLSKELRHEIEEDLRDDQPVHQVADRHCVPVYTVFTLLSTLKTGQGDLWLELNEEPVPF